MATAASGRRSIYLPRFTAGYAATSILFTDLDGDGKIDSVRFRPGTRSRILNAGKGDGTFLPEHIVDAGGVLGGAAAVDFDGDGKVDLAVGVDTGLSLLFGKGDGTFETPAPFALPGLSARARFGSWSGEGLAGDTWAGCAAASRSTVPPARCRGQPARAKAVPRVHCEARRAASLLARPANRSLLKNPQGQRKLGEKGGNGQSSHALADAGVRTTEAVVFKKTGT